jgi:hypothetical protein
MKALAIIGLAIALAGCATDPLAKMTPAEILSAVVNRNDETRARARAYLEWVEAQNAQDAQNTDE